MKKIYLALLVLSIGISSVAQERYLDIIFDEVGLTKDIKYGENITIMTVPVTGEPTLQELLLDFYEPEGDTAGLRPLVLVCHSGNFLPFPINEAVEGSKDDDNTTMEISRRLAKMGYVAANMDYRLGWNPQADSQEERTNTLINAAYRGIQDLRTAIRFFRKSVEEEGNPYRVDTSRIVAWGVGTGGYISLTAAVFDDYNKIMNTPKFFQTGEDGSPIPMVHPSVNGDIWGTSAGFIPDTETPLSIPNHVGYSSDFHLTVNVGGAMGDTSWMDENSGPFISFHVPSDPNAPYEEGVLIVPTTGDQVVEVQGSYLVDSLATAYGNNRVFQDLELDDPITQVARSRRGNISGLMPLIGSGGERDGGPWNWWDLDNVNSEKGLVGNPDMSKEKAMNYIDTIMAFYAPRAYAALDLGEALTATENLALETGMKVYPTLVNNHCIIETDRAHPFEEIHLYDQHGRMMKQIRNIRTTHYTMSLSEIPAGMYFVRIMTEKGASVSRIIKQ